jgi:hypothetical protein
LYRDGQVEDLGPMRASAINDQDQIVGRGTRPHGCGTSPERMTSTVKEERAGPMPSARPVSLPVPLHAAAPRRLRGTLCCGPRTAFRISGHWVE